MIFNENWTVKIRNNWFAGCRNYGGKMKKDMDEEKRSGYIRATRSGLSALRVGKKSDPEVPDQ